MTRDFHMENVAIPLSFDDRFWMNLESSCAGNKIGFFKVDFNSGGWMYLVCMRDSIKMEPFVRTENELFRETAEKESREKKFQVVINGPCYDVSGWGQFKVFLPGGVDPGATGQEGQVIYKGKVISGKPSNMYYLANYPGKTPKYKFGRGEAPKTKNGSAVGNLGPLIINGLPFGIENKYDPPQPKARRMGEPKDKYKRNMVQRSNLRFSVLTEKPDSSGKIGIGYNSNKNMLLLFVQPNGTVGISISGLRDALLNIGFDSAVYLDGSDSVMLMINNKHIVKQGWFKDETNVTGIGFRY